MADDAAKKRIAFVTYPGITLLDLVGPLTVLNRLGANYEVVLVGEKREPMATDLPIQVAPMMTYTDAPTLCAGRPGRQRRNDQGDGRRNAARLHPRR